MNAVMASAALDVLDHLEVAFLACDRDADVLDDLEVFQVLALAALDDGDDQDARDQVIGWVAAFRSDVLATRINAPVRNDR